MALSLAHALRLILTLKNSERLDQTLRVLQRCPRFPSLKARPQSEDLHATLTHLVACGLG